MKRILTILVSIYLFCLLEYSLFNVTGGWIMPDFLLLLVIFFNLYLGIRFSLVAAFIVGLFREAYSSYPFGLYLFSYITISYLSTWFMTTIYQRGSRDSRRLLVFSMKLAQLFIQWTLVWMFVPYQLEGFLTHVLLPELILTTLIANLLFEWLKGCAKQIAL